MRLAGQSGSQRLVVGTDDEVIRRPALEEAKQLLGRALEVPLDLALD
jgi:hypothetical protein